MFEHRRVLQLPVAYLPWIVGGREVYTHHLSQGLQAKGWDVRVVIHQNLSVSEPLGDREYENVPVTVLQPLPGQESRPAVYSCTPAAVPGFEELLQEFRPDIVHLHDFSVGANLLHLRMAKEYGARIVMTIHSPGQSCLQRSLLYRNETVCDGVIKTGRCTACRLGAMGIPRPIGSILGSLPVQSLNQESTNPFTRALTARAMTDRFKKAWTEMISIVDRIHVYADWVKEMMINNGVPREQLVFFRTGGPWQTQMTERKLERHNGKLRLAYSGRCDEVKGVHLLVKAIKSLPTDYPVEVSFYGPYWDTRYGQDLLTLMHDDPRFNPPEIVPNPQVQAKLSEADLCIVPSIWLETGPLVVLEAFAAGVPVIGSRLGGIAELVRDGTDGMLFPPGDSMALSRIIQTLAGDPAKLSQLKQGVNQPRTMSDVARDTAAVYEQLLTES